MTWTIGKAARSSGVAARTIRFYESCGVLPAPPRTSGGYRQYGQEDVEHLLFIRRARALGLSLRELKALTVTVNGASRAPVRPRVRELVRAHLSTVRGRIRELTLLERQLRHVLRRMDAPGSPRVAGRCRCLDLEEGRGRPPGSVDRRR
jgi:DNA-binding transcriptional MerR regulator